MDNFPTSLLSGAYKLETAICCEVEWNAVFQEWSKVLQKMFITYNAVRTVYINLLSVLIFLLEIQLVENLCYWNNIQRIFQRCKNSFYSSVMNRLRNLSDHWPERGVRWTVTVRERKTSDQLLGCDFCYTNVADRGLYSSAHKLLQDLIHPQTASQASNPMFSVM